MQRIHSCMAYHGKFWEHRPMQKQQHSPGSTPETVNESLFALRISRAGVRFQVHHFLALGINTSGFPNAPSGISNYTLSHSCLLLTMTALLHSVLQLFLKLISLFLKQLACCYFLKKYILFSLQSRLSTLDTEAQAWT